MSQFIHFSLIFREQEDTKTKHSAPRTLDSQILICTAYICPQSSQKCKQKILVKLSKYFSPDFAASVLETNAVATEEHDLDFSFCLMTSLSMFQQLFSLRWLMQQQEKKVYHFVLVGSPGLHKYMTSVNKVCNDLESTVIKQILFFFLFDFPWWTGIEMIN